ncbi:hypothetical protein BSK66_25480 [Paenibacillus odorifer]|uniref:hypothetical protein n=1 Tax=Paenibacillus TaxID=44249 RepID=UPI0003E1CED5|nr:MULTISPECIES: hypothetical protein [Paenibacillus]ETT46266.1 hypothetical protein C171_28462 [Paenibacillus sp. FSL H8-237]OME50194.1 hypothetical protein BSK66_25480 [Paenibacillus odorifer]
MAQQTMYPAIANSPGTELSAALTTAATTIAVVDATKLPAAPNVFTIGSDESSETILYTGKSGNSLTGCMRGFDGTTPKAWAIGSKVARYYTAYDHEAFRKNLTDLSGVTSESTTDVILAAGQQILNATKNARLQGLKVQGRTLIDLLGGAGSGESLTGLSFSATGIVLSNERVKSGSTSFKFSASASGKYAFKEYSNSLDTNKYYVLAGWIYIESYTDGAINLSLRDYGTTTSRYSCAVDYAQIGKWQFVYAKIPTTNLLVGTGFRLLFGVTGTGTSTSYFDEIRLYAVSAADYAAIGTTITGEAIDRILPYVPPNINGVDGLYVRRYGRNLYNGGIASTLTGVSYIENDSNSVSVTSDANGFRYATTKKYPVLPNTIYTLSYAASIISGTDAPVISVRKGSDGTGISSGVSGTGLKSVTFNTGAETEVQFLLYASYNTSAVQTKRYDNIQLEIGSTVTPFQPREDSLIAFGGVELHANPTDGSEPDILREVNGRYEVTRLWREMVLDGFLSWGYHASTTGAKGVYANLLAPAAIAAGSSPNTAAIAIKYNGNSLPRDGNVNIADTYAINSVSSRVYVVVSSTDSGWGDSYTPSTDEIKAYFNGWRMFTDGQPAATNVYSGTGTKAWAKKNDAGGIVDASGVFVVPLTSNDSLTGRYQLLYRLASPTFETVQEDGALSLLEGDNFIEVGSGYVSRERIIPYLWNSYYESNISIVGMESAKLKYKVFSIMSVYESSRLFQKWRRITFGLVDTLYGERFNIAQADYDSSQPYSVSYIKLDKSPVPSVTGFYAATEKAQLHDLTDAVIEIGLAVSTLAVKKSEKDAPGWIAPTLLNGFTALFNSRVPSYRKVNGVVEFTGALKFTSSTVNANLVIFRLPEGYRPKDQLDFGVLSGSGANRVFGGLEIMPTGEVYVLSGMGGDAIFLDGLPTFRVD